MVLHRAWRSLLPGLCALAIASCAPDDSGVIDTDVPVAPPRDASPDSSVVADSPASLDAPAPFDSPASLDVPAALDVPVPFDAPTSLDSPPPPFDSPAPPPDVPTPPPDVPTLPPDVPTLPPDVPTLPPDVPTPPPDVPTPPPVCPTPVEVVVYNQGGWNVVASAMHDSASPCADYYFSIPAVTADKTQPRAGGAAAGIRALGPRFHAMAEFHWGTWSGVTGMTWFQKGVEFRRRMTAADYTAGDTWAINELPSTTRSDAATRTNVRDAVRGLLTGPAGAPTLRGAVFIIGFGQPTMNLSLYKSHIETWLSDAAFWVDMNTGARWWAQEVYPDPASVCVPSTTVALRSDNTNNYVEHIARLANAGPAASATARSYLNRAYVPLMNSVWRAAAYSTDALSLDQMEHFVSGQVYAARAWSTDHPYPGGRIGFAWDHATGETAANETTLASRLASAIHYAYDNGGGSASHACSPSGAYTWCQCAVAGASFNPAWQGFGTW